MAKNSIGQSCGGCLVLVVLIIGGCYLASGWIDTGLEKLNEQQKANEAARKQLDIDMPLGTEARLRHNVTEALGSSNRNIPRVSRFEVDGQNVRVAIAFNDNLGQGLIRFGMRQDVVDTLKAVEESGYNFSSIAIDGTFPLVDKFGNSTESPVVRTEFSRNTVDRINWPQFLNDNIFEIADSSWVHPAMDSE